uniref:Polyadenylate-binding protein n=1 Tax=Percolomonas cosmopolitus TaxID=63605 RepID=A0A7S1PK37_9EUKA|mmetsp:Transcript_8052/g.29890  ORF Transcript_8052/g.29890 Transcript_8052/m.29890 type:complete len:519 (+) Transcript_8052:111-1667(+)
MTTAQGYAHSTLYVGDLHPDVDERILYDLFKEAGNIVSIHVCRDAVSRISLGYAYVNFQNAQEAEKAIETLNYTTIHDRPIRIMWSQRDPSLRKSGVGNVFVKNLVPEIDEKTLSDIFARFGPILSCKISYKNGKVGATERISNGYGFVHFKDQESADKAIKKMNGKFLNDRQISVTNYKQKSERPRKALDDTFTNVYVKHLPKEYDNDKLKILFSEFGDVQNAAVMTDEDGNSRGFGFVNFFDHEAANKSVEELSGRETGDEEDKTKTFFVCRAQTKEERAKFLQQQRTVQSQNQTQKQDTNLYVRNLSDEIDEAKLKELFEPYGEIRSVRVMRDTKKKVSRGFGFVCFARPEDASKAMTQMHGHMLNNKPLYVALHQPKIARKTQMEKFRREQGGVPNHMMGGPPHMMYGQFPYPMGPAMGYPPQNMMPHGAWDPNQMGGPAPHMMSEEERKQQVGNHLYSLVHAINPDNAAKITGMFLELKEEEIHELMTEDEKLRERVNDALKVLQSAQQTVSA